MSELVNRVRRLEQVAEENQGRRLVILSKPFEESKEECLSKHPEAQGDDVDIIFINRFCSDMEPSKPPASETQKEIESILSDLEGEGFTMEQIAGMVKGEIPIPDDEPAPAVVERPPAPPPPKHEDPFDVQPMRASDLVGLFKPRRFRR